MDHIAQPGLLWAFWIGFIVFVLFLVALQMPRVSRVWLSWLPSLLRNYIQPYFEPPPAVHPHLPDPNELPDAEDMPIYEQVPLAIMRSFLSAWHGVEDVKHYFSRLVITFFLFAIVVIGLLSILLAIQGVILRL